MKNGPNKIRNRPIKRLVANNARMRMGFDNSNRKLSRKMLFQEKLGRGFAGVGFVNLLCRRG
jgi:hypothetical protein